MVDFEGHKFSCKLTRVSFDSWLNRSVSFTSFMIAHLSWTIRNELTVGYAQNYNPLKIPTYPTHSDYYSLVINFNVLCLSKFRFLRPVLLEEAKGIQKWKIMHKLRLYHVYFVLCKWHKRNFLGRSRSHDNRSLAMIYIKTPFPHDCQCMRSLSGIKAGIKVTYGDVFKKELLIDIQIWRLFSKYWSFLQELNIYLFNIGCLLNTGGH